MILTSVWHIPVKIMGEIPQINPLSPPLWEIHPRPIKPLKNYTILSQAVTSPPATFQLQSIRLNMRYRSDRSLSPTLGAAHAHELGSADKKWKRYAIYEMWNFNTCSPVQYSAWLISFPFLLSIVWAHLKVWNKYSSQHPSPMRAEYLSLDEYK